MKKQKVLIPLPSYGFDPSEAAIPWKLMVEDHIEVVFATPNGEKAIADQVMLDGHTLGIWKSLLMARKDAVEAHDLMIESEEFRNPLEYKEANEMEFDGLLLPGGHDKRVREYLESPILHKLVVDFFRSDKPVAAVCHGVVLVSRSIDPISGKSVLYDYETTALLKSQEKLAYNLTRLWLKDYYLTYPEITVEDEVKSSLSNPDNFIQGAFPVLRDTSQNFKSGFAHRSKNYISARWPGDIYNFSSKLIDALNERISK